MRFRLTAFGLHLLGSACALTLVLGGLYLGWYHWPGWYLTAVTRVLLIVGLVDLGLGPTLTLIIANPEKPRRVLARDIAIIATVQLAALIYGATTLWQGRPLYYTFSANRLETVQASDIENEEIALARRENPSFAPHWYSLPRWVWAPLPEDPDKAADIVKSKSSAGARTSSTCRVISSPGAKVCRRCASSLRSWVTSSISPSRNRPRCARAWRASGLIPISLTRW